MNQQLLTEIIALILQLGPVALDLFLKLPALLNLGPDEKQNVANAIAAANASDADTLKLIADWKQQHNLS